MPLAALLGWARRAVPIYGSGGFTSYGIDRLQRQLAGWAAAGMKFVKMKIGRDPAADVERVRAARAAIGDRVALFVDANGAYSRKQALAMAARFADAGVTWFEEPVSSDDLAGLRLVRDGVGGQMDVAAGEYGYDPFYFRRMLARGRGGRAAGGRHALRWRDRLRDGARAGRRARIAAVGALRAGPARPAGLRADPRCATSSISTTTSESRGCCSTARRCHRTARWLPIPAAPGWACR